MRVLIVEDEAKMAGLLRRGLERDGMAVDLAGDAPAPSPRGRRSLTRMRRLPR